MLKSVCICTIVIISFRLCSFYLCKDLLGRTAFIHSMSGVIYKTKSKTHVPQINCRETSINRPFWCTLRQSQLNSFNDISSGHFYKLVNDQVKWCMSVEVGNDIFPAQGLISFSFIKESKGKGCLYTPYQILTGNVLSSLFPFQYVYFSQKAGNF